MAPPKCAPSPQNSVLCSARRGLARLQRVGLVRERVERVAPVGLCLLHPAQHLLLLPAQLAEALLSSSRQCQIYEADSEVVTGEMRDFSTLVPRLLEQLQRERDGQPLTSRRLVVFVFNGHNHYDATVPQ